MRRLDYWKSLFVGACCVAVFAQSAPPQAPQAQDWEKAAGGKRTFDVASVKLDPGQGPPRPSSFPLGVRDASGPVGDRFSADFTVFTYIAFAYKVGILSADILKAMQAPEWVMTDRYAIEARADGISTKDQMRLMMQSLLAERFALKAHFENRTFPAFALELVNPGRTGPKLRPHSEGVPCEARDATVFPPACGGPGYFMMPNRIEKGGARNMTLAQMAEGLPGMAGVDRPMVDRTGLQGLYDFTIEFAPDPHAQPAAATDTAADLPAPTFIEALREQLGLKLESVKADIRILVIDHIERPSGN